MNSHHVIAIYVLLGHKNFAKLMKIVFDIDVGSRMDEFLKRLATWKGLRMKLLEFRLNRLNQLNQECNTSTITTAIDAEIVMIESLLLQTSQTHRLVSRRNRISKLLGAGGVQQVEEALALHGKSLANATDEEVNAEEIKKLRSVCPGNVAWKRMSTEEESQDESLVNKFDEYTGEWENRKEGTWSMEEEQIIMAMKDNWKVKNMNKTLASRIEGRSTHQVRCWISNHRKKCLRG